MLDRLVPGRSVVIAEAGLNHNGSLSLARQLIDVAAAAGVDIVKFQKRTVERLAVKATLDAKDNRFPQFGSTYREIREHLEFDAAEYRQLKAYSEERGLGFMVTAFDIEAVDFLEALGVEAYKLASHSLTNLELLEYVARTYKPVVLSTGMADFEEVDAAVSVLKQSGAPLMLMHCVSSYPTPIEDCNLQMIDVLAARYSVPVGYSGHELGVLPTVAAVAMGAQLVERHFTLDKTMVGFDHKISLTASELTDLIQQIRQVEAARGTGERAISETEWITRRKYHVSMASATPIGKGAVLSASMVAWRNPGTGIPTKLAHTVIGKRANRDIAPDELLTPEMFDPA